MDRTSLSRRTVDEDPEVIPGTQIWIDGSGQIWHELHGVHTRMWEKGMRKEWREWRGDFMVCMRRMGVPQERYYMSGDDPSKVWNIADSFVVLCSIWGAAEFSRIPAWATASMNVLTALKNRIELSLAPAQRLSIACGDVEFLVQGSCMQGWGAWYAARTKSTREAWLRIWQRMPECVPYDIADDEQRIATIIHFALHFRRVRIDASGKISRATHRVILALQQGILEFLADGLDRYLHTVYLPARPRHKPPPARESPKKSKEGAGMQSGTCPSAVQRVRRYVSVDPEALWDMMQSSRQSGASLAQVAVVRKDDPDAGCCGAVTGSALSSMNATYRERMRLAFTGTNHLCIVADPATHSKKETMIGICWSWEAGVGAYGVIQHIAQTKHVLPTEQDMSDHLATLSILRKLDRVASFRQLQALSNIIEQIGCWRGIDDFRLGGDYLIDAVGEGEVRIVEIGDESAIAMRVWRNGGNARRVLPEAALAPAQSHPLLVVNLDQGSVGAAGIVFAQEQMGAMVFAHWDKFHRLMRDISLALGGTAGGLFLKARIYSAHLWSLNYKPWGTGLFGTQKTQLLNVFMACQGPYSPVFRKYAARIAEAVDRALECDEDYEALFDDLPYLARSFQAAMDTAKMGRWFSWNNCAKEQLVEFWVQKMILEDHLEVGGRPCSSAGLVDPDETGIPFDELQAAAKAKTPQAQLAQLKSVNGGFKLAYKLMTTQLYDYCKILYTITKPLWNWYTDQVPDHHQRHRHYQHRHNHHYHHHHHYHHRLPLPQVPASPNTSQPPTTSTHPQVVRH